MGHSENTGLHIPLLSSQVVISAHPQLYSTAGFPSRPQLLQFDGWTSSCTARRSLWLRFRRPSLWLPIRSRVLLKQTFVRRDRTGGYISFDTSNCATRSEIEKTLIIHISNLRDTTNRYSPMQYLQC